jgi:prepilin-type N-terminal cleavage/methylation domain-containing protein
MSVSMNGLRRGFSLIELVIVVVIIGIIAAIAIPRMSRGAAGAADSTLQANLRMLRNAIDLWHTEHGGTIYPPVASIASHLTLYSNETGSATNTTKDTTHFLGPYLAAVPALNVGARKGQSGIAANDAGTIGWLYTEATGAIRPNTTTEVDSRGVLYSSY